MIKLPSWAKALLPMIVGTATAKTIIDFCESGLVDALAALKKGDVEGFVNALPDQIKAAVESYIAKKVAAVAPIAPVVPAAVSVLQGSTGDAAPVVIHQLGASIAVSNVDASVLASTAAQLIEHSLPAVPDGSK